MLLNILVVAASLQMGTNSGIDTRCVDPATPLGALALTYENWPEALSPADSVALKRLRAYLAGNGKYVDALKQYERLRAGNGTYRSLGLGLVLATGPDLNFPGRRGYRFSRMDKNANANDVAARYLMGVVAADPTQWLAAVALARMALGTREPKRISDAVATLNIAKAANPTNETVTLALADLYVATQKGDSAEGLLTSIKNCPAAMHLLAVARILKGDTSVAPRDYFAALSLALPRDLDRFYEDAAVISTHAEREQYAALSGLARRTWLIEFWQRSADASGVLPHQRIARHFQRLEFAERNYRREVWGPPPEEDSDLLLESSLSLPWDTRGIVHIRHGAPDQIVRSLQGVLTRIPENETWVYLNADIPWVLQFTRRAGPDWLFSIAIGCGLARSPATLARSTNNRSQRLADLGGGATEARDYYLQLAQFDPRFGGLARYCGLASVGGGNVADYRSRVLQLRQYYDPLMTSIIATESATTKFLRQMRMIVAAYSFQDISEHTEVLSVSWIPLSELRNPPVERLRLTSTMVQGSVEGSRIDTTIALPSMRESGRLLALATVWRNRIPGPAYIRIVAADAGDAQRGSNQTRTIQVPAASRGVSDVVIAEPEVQGVIVRDGASLAPIPNHSIPFGQAFRLYAEVYNVPAGAAVQTSIRVRLVDARGVEDLRKLFPRKQRERALTFESIAGSARPGMHVVDHVVANDLMPGMYSVELTATIGARNITRSAQLIVEMPDSQE
jgi:tetratricopeptide (TPR) repeat protein